MTTPKPPPAHPLPWSVDIPYPTTILDRLGRFVADFRHPETAACVVAAVNATLEVRSAS